MPRDDLLRIRRLVDVQLGSGGPPLPFAIVDGGLRFEDWLEDELELDHDKVRRLLVFIDEFGAFVRAHGRQPAIPQIAEHTNQSVATINRRLAEFRGLFPTENDPSRIARALQQALNDQSLWTSLDQSLEARIGDVPVVPRRVPVSS